MPTAKLTKRLIDALSPGDKDLVVWDEESKGFAVKVTPQGRKVFFCYYRTRDGQQRRPKIGDFGKWTVEQARGKARDILHAADKGADPSQEKQAARRAITFQDFADDYLKRYSRPRKRTAARDEYLLEKHVRKALGKKTLKSITRADIQRLHSSLSETPVEANRLHQLLRAMFNVARAWAVVPDDFSNPCLGVRRYKEESRKRYLAVDEFKTLMETITAAEQEGKLYQPALDAIVLLIYTGARRGEILNCRWDYVDLAGGFIDLPQSKTGRKRIYLNRLAAERLMAMRERQAEKPSVWICPGRGGIKPMPDVKSTWEEVRRRAGLEDVHLHDLRHSFASIGVGQNVSLHIVGQLLGHEESATTQLYAHLADSPVRAAAELIGERMAAIMGGAKIISVQEPVERAEPSDVSRQGGA